jgi:indole-3-glycerol phosphate synthase
MIESHLTQFAQRRLESLKTVDQLEFPIDALQDSPFYLQKRPSLRESLLPNSQSADELHFLFEIKKASPTMGTLSKIDAVDMCSTYVEQGAKAISVLVDQVNFSGHPNDLKNCCSAHSHLPFLHKDFVATSYQVQLAKSLGASSVLLMCQLLEQNELKDLYDQATAIGLEPFVEVHDANELDFALSLNPPIIGINSRDFKTKGLPIDLNTAPKLLSDLKSWPQGVALVAQSGLFNGEDLARLRNDCPKGLPHCAQIGSSLSQAGEIPAWIKTYL